jgi:hypothetical protein
MTAPARRRRPAATATRRYHWFQGESVRELARQLGEAGPDARLEVRVDAKQSMTFTVVPSGISTQSHTSINESHLCPPDCPGEG